MLKKFGAFLLLLVLSSTFFELGLWQLHRAQAMNKLSKPAPEKPVVDLATVASVGSNLRTTGFNRLVSFKANYTLSYTAPHQFIEGKYQDLDVRLAELSNHRAVLVVRGIQGRTKTVDGTIQISGRLYPRQTEDAALGTDKQLSRLDPALIAGTPGVQLFDGYVIATGEKDSQGEVAGSYLPAPAQISKAAGFYWQHIAYVVTWWFMALLVWGFPFYGRLVKNREEEDMEGKVAS